MSDSSILRASTFTRYLDEDGLETLANRIEEVYVKKGEEGSRPIPATYDEPTALYAHAVGDIIYMNGHFYKVTVAIAVNDAIAVGTNITADTGIDPGTNVMVDKLPGNVARQIMATDVVVDNTGTSFLNGTTAQDVINELDASLALGRVYNIETAFTSGSVLDAINTLYSELSDNAIGVCVVNVDVTGRPIGTGWGQIILFRTYMLQECHVIYQDTWSSRSVTGIYSHTNHTVTWDLPVTTSLGQFSDTTYWENMEPAGHGGSENSQYTICGNLVEVNLVVKCNGNSAITLRNILPPVHDYKWCSIGLHDYTAGQGTVFLNVDPDGNLWFPATGIIGHVYAAHFCYFKA